ncbi:MAG: glycosyltransferase family 4 protein [Chloroflexi bacterium]|nr:glycosyltransferase family 4 protein [Chloroflexota bacterium]
MELVRRGHLVSVVGFYDVREKTECQEMGVRVIRLPRSKTPFANIWVHRFVLAQELKKLNQKAALDLVEGPELSFAFLPKLPEAGYVIRLHGGHHFFSTELGRKPRMGRGWYEKISFRNADFFCAVSQYVADKTSNLLNIHGPIEIIPNPVDTELFSPSPTKEEQGLIAFVGTVCEKKGIRQLIQAMPLILDVHPTARLLVIGRDQYDKNLNKCFTEHLKQIMDSAIHSQVFFLGAVNHNELPALLNKASLCVYPSHMEAMPIAWLEGMSMGKTVVASMTGPGVEIIEDGENGLLCNPFDPKSIADKVNCALSDTNLRNKLGFAARKKVEVEYCMDVLTEKNLNFYRNCLSAIN